MVEHVRRACGDQALRENEDNPNAENRAGVPHEEG